MSTNQSPLLSIPEAMAYRKLSRSTLYRFAKEGRFKIHKDVGRCYILRSDLDADIAAFTGSSQVLGLTA